MNLFYKKKKEKKQKSTKFLHGLYFCRQVHLIDGKREWQTVVNNRNRLY